jgi:hypothetical protein
MTQIISGIAQGAPVWVWPLLVGLVVLGLLSTRDRAVPRQIFYALPFMGLITVNSLVALPQPQFVWPSVIIGFALGAFVAYGLQSRWIEGRDGNRLRVSGEWLTFAVLMMIFWSNFVGGTLQAIAPGAYQSPEFLIPFAFVLALGSGSFLGRSLRALRYKGAQVLD